MRRRPQARPCDDETKGGAGCARATRRGLSWCAHGAAINSGTSGMHGVCVLCVWGRRAGKKSGGWGNGRNTAKEYVASEALQRVGRAARQVQVPAAMCKWRRRRPAWGQARPLRLLPAERRGWWSLVRCHGRARGLRSRRGKTGCMGVGAQHSRASCCWHAVMCVCVHCVGVTVRQVGVDGVGAGARGLAPQGRRRWRH